MTSAKLAVFASKLVPMLYSYEKWYNSQAKLIPKTNKLSN